MSEKKKLMPSISNYLSESEDNSNDDFDTNESSNTKIHTKINITRLSNESKSLNAQLDDISSCEDDYQFDNNQPLYKVMNRLTDKDKFRIKNKRMQKRDKKPSHFLLFSRMKQQKHSSNSFDDLLNIIDASWDNMQPEKNEEFIANLDLKYYEYREVLTSFRQILLPSSKDRINYKIKPHNPSSDTIDGVLITKNSSKIPQRIKSVLIVSEKSNGVTHRLSLKSKFNTDSNLDNVTMVKSNCYNSVCENRSVTDYRWDGQYCSASCLIKDCQVTFQAWLTTVHRQVLTDGDRIINNNNDDALIYLTSSSSLRDDSDESISRDENLFESLQNNLI